MVEDLAGDLQIGNTVGQSSAILISRCEFDAQRTNGSLVIENFIAHSVLLTNPKKIV